jgi:hypothetical protein
LEEMGAMRRREGKISRDAAAAGEEWGGRWGMKWW